MSNKDDELRDSVMFTPSGVSFYKVKSKDEEDEEKPGIFKRIINKVKGWFLSPKKRAEKRMLDALPPELREIGKKILKEHPDMKEPTHRRVELHGALDIINFLLEQSDLAGDREKDRIVLRLSEDEDADVKIHVIIKERGPEVVASVVPVRQETGMIHYNPERMSAIAECALRMMDCFPYISLRVDYEHGKVIGDIPVFVAGLSGIIKGGHLMMASHYLLSRLFIGSLAMTDLCKALLRVDAGEDAQEVFLQEMPRMRKRLREETTSMKFFGFEPKED